jgi:hypothetical protein
MQSHLRKKELRGETKGEDDDTIDTLPLHAL